MTLLPSLYPYEYEEKPYLLIYEFRSLVTGENLHTVNFNFPSFPYTNSITFFNYFSQVG